MPADPAATDSRSIDLHRHIHCHTISIGHRVVWSFKRGRCTFDHSRLLEFIPHTPWIVTLLRIQFCNPMMQSLYNIKSSLNISQQQYVSAQIWCTGYYSIHMYELKQRCENESLISFMFNGRAIIIFLEFMSLMFMDIIYKDIFWITVDHLILVGIIILYF